MRLPALEPFLTAVTKARKAGTSTRHALSSNRYSSGGPCSSITSSPVTAAAAAAAEEEDEEEEEEEEEAEGAEGTGAEELLRTERGGKETASTEKRARMYTESWAAMERGVAWPLRGAKGVGAEGLGR